MSLLSSTRTPHYKRPERRSSRRTPWLGVDVGPHSVKLAVAKLDQRGFWCLDYTQRIPWQKDAEPFASAEHFGKALYEVLRQSQSGWRARGLTQAAFSLPETAVSSEDLAIETEDLATVQTAADQTIRQLYGCRPDKLAFDVWNPVPVEGSFADPPAAQLLWAEPEVVKSCMQAFRNCRLTAEVLDVAPLTTARASEMLTGSCDSELMIDWGSNRLTLTWILDGQPRFTRFSIRGGGEELVQSVCDSHRFSPEEAELLLARYGLPGQNTSGFNRMIEKAAADSLDVLLEEIDCTLTYLKSRYPRQPIDRIILSGGGGSDSQPRLLAVIADGT